MEEATANGTAGESSSDARRPSESFARRISTSLRFNPPASSSSSSAADTALPPPPSVSSTSKAPRRSLAHQPRLLGYEDDSLFELRGLPPPPLPPLVRASHASSSGKKSSPVITSPSPRGTSRRTFPRLGAAAGEGEGHTPIIDDDQFRIGEDEEEEGNGAEHGDEADDFQRRQDDDTSSSSHNQRKLENTNGPIETASYSGPKGYQMDHRETSASLSSSRDTGHGGNIDDLERGGLYQPEEEIEDEAEVQLQFEPTTKREKTWMWTSVALVAVLTFVSVAIALDWIDWPGDGLGAD